MLGTAPNSGIFSQVATKYDASGTTITPKHNTKSYTTTPCFVCNELLCNKLGGELIILLECSQLVHEQCLVEVLRGIPISPTTTDLAPPCFCRLDFPHKFLPKDKSYLNKLLVKKNNKEKERLSLNCVLSPNFLSLSSTLIKKPQEQLASRCCADLHLVNNTLNHTNSTIQSPEMAHSTGFTDLQKGQTLGDPILNSFNNYRIDQQKSTLPAFPSIDDKKPGLTFWDGYTDPLTVDSTFCYKPVLMENNYSKLDQSKLTLKRKLSKAFEKFISSPQSIPKRRRSFSDDLPALVPKTKSNEYLGNDEYFPQNFTNQVSTPREMSQTENCNKHTENLSSEPSTPKQFTPIPASQGFLNFLETDTNPIHQSNEDFHTNSTTSWTDEKSVFSSNGSISTAETVTPKIHANKFLSLDTLRNQFLEYLISMNDTIGFTQLVKYGNLRLVDNLLVSLDLLHWTSSIIYLFEKYLIVLQNRDIIQIDMHDIHLRLLSQTTIELTSRWSQNIYIKASGLLVEKWVVAIYDTKYKFPSEVFTSTIQFNVELEDSNIDDDRQTYSIYFDESKFRKTCVFNCSCSSKIETNTFKDNYFTDVNSMNSIKDYSDSDYESDQDLITSIYNKLSYLDNE